MFQPPSSGVSACDVVAPKVTLSGGEAHHSSLVTLWRNDRLTDIALCAEGIEFKAHRAALASSSGYFLSLFDSGMRDAACSAHAIEGIRSPVLEALLAYVYEGSCEVEEDLLTEMLDAAARLVIDPLKEACAGAIQARLAPCNALDVWRLADLYMLPALEKAAFRFALGGFEELPPQSASGVQVLALVQEDELVVKNEEAVFQWMVRWWEATERPEAELLAAMKHVRFAAMDAGFLQTTVRAWLESKEGSRRRRRPHPRRRRRPRHDILRESLLEAGHLAPRSALGHLLVYVLGGTGACVNALGTYVSALSTAEVYNPRTAAWNQVSSMPTDRSRHGVAVLDGKIYAIGGLDDGSESDIETGPFLLMKGAFLNTADVYDPQSDQWQPLMGMRQHRGSFATATVDGKIYAIGGENLHTAAMPCVEAFDPQGCGPSRLEKRGSIDRPLRCDDCLQELPNQLLGTWSDVAAMSSWRVAHAAAVVDRKIYVIGGNDGHNIGGNDGYYDDAQDLDSVEVYDPQADSWQQVASMPQARRAHAAVAMAGKIYVSGGSMDGNLITDTVVVFDPQADTWTESASMSQPRQFHASAAIGGKLYVFGGYSDDGPTASVEAFDPTSNTWAHVSELSDVRDEFAAVAF